jgi:hypothetical protein
MNNKLIPRCKALARELAQNSGLAPDYIVQLEEDGDVGVANWIFFVSEANSILKQQDAIAKAGKAVKP